MRILGVDPGLTRCGLGLVDAGSGRAVSFVSVEVATASTTLPAAERIGKIADAVDAIFDGDRPDMVAIERVFAQHNVRTVMATAQISGVVMFLARQRGVPIATYTPSEVKAAVTGNGRADKKQVAFMVAKILRLPEPPSPADASDALAIAITHAWRGIGAHGADGGALATPGSTGGGAATAAQRRWHEAERLARERKI